jgi:hypothetical protein
LAPDLDYIFLYYINVSSLLKEEGVSLSRSLSLRFFFTPQINDSELFILKLDFFGLSFALERTSNSNILSLYLITKSPS